MICDALRHFNRYSEFGTNAGTAAREAQNSSQLKRENGTGRAESEGGRVAVDTAGLEG